MADQVKINEAEENLQESYDTSDPESVNKARKKSSRTRATRLEFVAAAMTTMQGRAWFYDLLNRCYIFRTPFMSGDMHSTAFRCGENNIGLQILSDIQDSAPELYITMIKEAKER